MAEKTLPTYLSLDEGIGLHDHAVGPMKQLLDISSGPLALAWVIPAGFSGTWETVEPARKRYAIFEAKPAG